MSGSAHSDVWPRPFPPAHVRRFSDNDVIGAGHLDSIHNPHQSAKNTANLRIGLKGGCAMFTRAMSRSYSMKAHHVPILFPRCHGETLGNFLHHDASIKAA